MARVVERTTLPNQNININFNENDEDITAVAKLVETIKKTQLLYLTFKKKALKMYKRLLKKQTQMAERLFSHLERASSAIKGAPPE